jgi:hypothetical protein
VSRTSGEQPVAELDRPAGIEHARRGARADDILHAMQRSPAFLLALACIPAACRATSETDARSDTEARTGAVTGIVRLDGSAPERREITLPAEAQEHYGVERIDDERWLVDAGGGVADCVVTLEPLGDTAELPLEPSVAARLVQAGARYEPHVLVVPAKSRVTLSNVDGLCGCFHLHARRNPGGVHKLARGEEHEITLERAENIRVASNMEFWMNALIVVVDTPHHAVTEAGGTFRIDGLPPGRYRATVQHAYGRGTRSTIEIVAGKTASVELPLRPR